MTSERSSRPSTAARPKGSTGYGVMTVAGAVLSVLSVLFLGCAGFSRGGPLPDAGDAATDSISGAGDATLSFATDVYPLLTAACPRCHVPGGQAGDTQLLFSGDAAKDLVTLMPFIDTNAPASSRVLAKMSGQGHGGGVVYASGTTAYETVLQWIEQGASP